MKVEPIIIEDPVIVLVGPTAVGKTALTFEIAKEFDCEIISMDSMQVYRHMDIGTAKPSPEEQTSVRHHLIDIAYPDEQYNAAQFVKDCLKAIRIVQEKGRVPLVTGGTGLYLSSLVSGLFDVVNVKDDVRASLKQRYEKEGLATLYAELLRVDPVTAARIHCNDRQRILRGLEIYYSTEIPWSVHLEHQKKARAPVKFDKLFEVALSCEREILHQRIAQRTEVMLQQGLIEEVEMLNAMGYSPELPSMQAIGYRHVNMFLKGEWGRGEVDRLLVRDTRRYAKRQMTWFRRHKTLHWFDRLQADQVLKEINLHLTAQN